MRDKVPAQFYVSAVMIAILVELEKLTEAAKIVRELLSEFPEVSCDYVTQFIPIANKQYLTKFMNGLRKAGLPEHAPSVS